MELFLPDDCFLLTIDLKDSPMAEIPISDMVNGGTTTLLHAYPGILQATVLQQLEDTVWLTELTRSVLLDAGFRTYNARSPAAIISLRQASLQRLITTSLDNRPSSIEPIQIPLLIRFMLSAADVPRAPQASTVASTAPVRSVHSASPPSEHSHVSETELQDQVSDLPLFPSAQSNVPDGFDLPDETAADPLSAAGRLSGSNGPATFRGNPVDTSRTAGLHPHGPSMRRGFDTPVDSGDRHSGAGDPSRRSGGSLFDSVPRNRSTPLTRTPTRLHPFSNEVTFGAETFDEYMTQFIYGEVKFKDFRKASSSSTPAAMILLSTGSSCSVLLVSNGGSGAHPTNRRKKTPFTVPGGLTFPSLSVPTKNLCLPHIQYPYFGDHVSCWVPRTWRRSRLSSQLRLRRRLCFVPPSSSSPSLPSLDG